jgi:hypothetical protein
MAVPVEAPKYPPREEMVKFIVSRGWLPVTTGGEMADRPA